MQRKWFVTGIVAVLLVVGGLVIGLLVAPDSDSTPVAASTGPPLLPTAVPTQAVGTASAEELSVYKEVIQRVIDDAFNAGDQDMLAEVYAADFVGHLPDSVVDREDLTLTDYAEVILLLRRAVPDLVVTPEIVIAEGQFVAVRARLRGTFASEFYDFPPTGEVLDLVFTVIHRFGEDGKIAEAWIAYDTRGVAQQLGETNDTGG